MREMFMYMYIYAIIINWFYTDQENSHKKTISRSNQNCVICACVKVIVVY